MKSLLLLLKVQLLQFLQSSGKKKRRSVFLTILLVIAALVYFSGLSCITVFTTLKPEQYAQGLFSSLLINSTLLTFMGLSWSSGLLFGFHDYDLLMSLPLKKEQITAAKLASFFVLEYLYSLPLVLPVVVIYAFFAHPPVLSYVWMFIGFFGLPVLPAILAIAGGSLINVLTAGKKYESLWRGLSSILLALAFAGFSMFRSSSMDAAQNMMSKMSSARYLFPVSWLYSKAIVLGNGLYILMEMVATFGLLALILHYLSGLVLHIAAKGNQGYHVQNFRLKQGKENSVLSALVKRERKMMLGDINGLFNIGFGAVLLIGAGIYTILFPEKSPAFQIAEHMQNPALAAQQAIFIASMLIMTVNQPCVSISREGKNLWILRSLPISEEMIFISKILCPLEILIVPCIPVIGIALWRIGAPIWMIILGMIYLLASWIMTALLGLIANLLFPKLDWDRSIIVYKRSLSAFIGMGSGFLLGGVIIALGMTYKASAVFLPIMLGIVCLISLILFWILRYWGVHRFRNLI